MNSTYSRSASDPSVSFAPAGEPKSGITVVRVAVMAVGVVALTFGMFAIKHAESDMGHQGVVQAVPSASPSS